MQATQGGPWRTPKAHEALIFLGGEDFRELLRTVLWSRRQESNLHFTLRRRVFYPLNYGERSDSADMPMRLGGADPGAGPEYIKNLTGQGMRRHRPAQHSPFLACPGGQ